MLISSIKDGLFSEVVMSQDLNVIANASNKNKDETKYLGTKNMNTIEVTIPAGSKSQYIHL